MKRLISDMAKYLKKLVPANIPETYAVKPMFKHISGEENIRKGILAFRDFLYLVYDRLIADGSLYDRPPKNTKNGVSHPSLPVSYQFLDNVNSVLFNIGYHGKLAENGDSIILDDIQLLTFGLGPGGGQMKAKISGPKLIKVLRFLTCCGICIDGIDLDMKRIDKSKVTTLEISYPDKAALLTGLKVMAIAQRELDNNSNHYVFLRCDYRVLKDEDTDVTLILKDFVNPLSARVQDLAIKLHQRCMDAGMTCVVDVFYLTIRFIYSYKSKEVLTFYVSSDTEYLIIFKAQNTHKYTDVIEKFPIFMQERIARGYGCNKKMYGEPCQKGCHGFSFVLNDSILDISHDIEIWIDKEISCLQKK